MAFYQNTTVDKTKLIIGNYKIGIATYGSTIATVYVNLGAGIVNSFEHNIEKYEVQAGNAPDPIEGISDETFTVAGELIEYSAANLAKLYAGVVLTTGTAADGTLTMGGYTELTPFAFYLVNSRQYVGSGATAISCTTTIFLPKATAETGLAFTAKSDNDTDPINVMAFTVTAKLDTTLSTGTQLVTIKRVIAAA